MGSLNDLAELDKKKLENSTKRVPKGWRYTPYVLANYGGSGLKDYVEMPKKSNSTTRESSSLLESRRCCWQVLDLRLLRFDFYN